MLSVGNTAAGYTDHEQIVLTWRKVHFMPISRGHYGAIFPHLVEEFTLKIIH